MTEKQAQFLQELRELCEKHQLVAIPTYQLKPSAHDPMYIVPLDDDWREFLNRRVYAPENSEEVCELEADEPVYLP